MYFSISSQARHRPTKGKGAHDPTQLLPTLPTVRQKPTWSQNPPSFVLTGKPDAERQDGREIDLVSELTARKYDNIATAARLVISNNQQKRNKNINKYEISVNERSLLYFLASL